MIGVSTEVQLLALAALFYVYDSALLLYANEGTLTSNRQGWSIKTGDTGFTVRGRNLVFPNLLLPHRPVFRLSWDCKKPVATSTVDWDSEKSLYGAFIPMVYGMVAALFLILPAVLFLHRSDFALLTCLALIYLNAVLTGITLYFSRKQLDLSKSKCWSLFWECLLCPPLTINIIRKISTQRVLHSSLVAAGASLLKKVDWQQLREELLSQIDSELEDANDQEKSILKAVRSSLQNIKK